MCQPARINVKREFTNLIQLRQICLVGFEFPKIFLKKLNIFDKFFLFCQSLSNCEMVKISSVKKADLNLIKAGVPSIFFCCLHITEDPV